MRPVHDGVLITSTLDSTTPFPRVSKPLMISSVRNEAGPTIYSQFTSVLDTATYDVAVNQTFGAPRMGTILAFPSYRVPVLNDGQPSDARVQLEVLGTDYIWRCSAWTFARNWVGNGGNAYVGLYVLGATYPSNEAISFCTEPGSVCHQDDIMIVVRDFQLFARISSLVFMCSSLARSPVRPPPSLH